jgi:hypothetical protein
MSNVSSTVPELEFRGDDLALYGDIIIDMYTPDPVVELDSPRPKETGTEVYSPWGETNDFPQQVIAKVEADTELGALLDWKGRLLQGKEVIAMQLVWSDEKKDYVAQRVNDQEIMDFLSDIAWQRYWREACVDFTWFQNIFPDLIKSKGGKTIATISCHQAAWSRFGKMDNKGTIKKAYVSAMWPDAKVGDDYTQEHNVVDPYASDVIETTKKNKALKRFVYPVNYPSPGKAYYSLSPWIAFLNSDWYKLKNLIPKWKLKFMEKLLSAAKILTIHKGYWRTHYKDWDALSRDEQLDLKKKKVGEISKSLSGIEGVGTTILSETIVDDAGNSVPAITITAIDNGFTKDTQLETSQEGSQHLMRGLNVDPTLIGNGPGRGNDAGSGSDKRIAMNIGTALLTPYRNVILEPLKFKAKYDGWTERIKNLFFVVVEVDLGTLDDGPTSKDSIPVTAQPSK